VIYQQQSPELWATKIAMAAFRCISVAPHRAFLLTVAKRKASTVNAHLTAIDDFFRRRDLGPAAAKRQELPQAAPRALSEQELTRWLRSVERASARDRALAYTELYGGTRGGETVALDTGDVRTSARKGHLVVRYGKGGKYREVPLHPKLRPALDDWLAERAGRPGAATSPALFLNARGGRLSTRGAARPRSRPRGSSSLRQGPLSGVRCQAAPGTRWPWPRPPVRRSGLPAS
jgi:integrase